MPLGVWQRLAGAFYDGGANRRRGGSSGSQDLIPIDRFLVEPVRTESIEHFADRSLDFYPN